MGRLWGVLWGAVVVLGSAYADVSSGAPRTPNGMLWAGTTFQLRACATANNLLVAQSGVAQVQVGQVIRWQWRLESENALSVPQGTDAVFRVRVVNDGNGWDNLTFGLARYEIEQQQNWTIELFENRSGNGQVSGSPSVNGAGSLLPPAATCFTWYACVRLAGRRPPMARGRNCWRRRTARSKRRYSANSSRAFAVTIGFAPAHGAMASTRISCLPSSIRVGYSGWVPIRTRTRRASFYTRDAVERPSRRYGLGNERLVVWAHAAQLPSYGL
jgi:hypothetical protein